MKSNCYYAEDSRETAIVCQEIDGIGRGTDADLFPGHFQIFRIANFQKAVTFKVSDFRIRVGDGMTAHSTLAAQPFGVRVHGRRKDVVFSLSLVLIHFQTLLLSVQCAKKLFHA